jgi:hypothetical protein
MTASTPVSDRLTRRLGAVPWYQDGFRGMSVRAHPDVPCFDDSMIRGALMRAALTCSRYEALERALNRELWPLGYVADLERSVSDRAMVQVEISADR